MFGMLMLQDSPTRSSISLTVLGSQRGSFLQALRVDQSLESVLCLCNRKLC